MTPLPHHYAVHLSGASRDYADVSSLGLPPLRLAAPADFDGPGDAWSPEHLLLVRSKGACCSRSAPWRRPRSCRLEATIASVAPAGAAG